MIPDSRDRSNHAVAFHWINGTRPKFRSSNGNFWFEGDVIYSYRTAVARKYNTPAGRVILMTSNTYSVTTSGKHMNAIAHACFRCGHRGGMLWVPDVMNHEPEYNMRKLMEGYANALTHLASVPGRRAVHDWERNAPYERMLEAKKFARAFLTWMPEFDIETDMAKALAMHQEKVDRHNSPQAVKRRERTAAFRNFRRLIRDR